MEKVLEVLEVHLAVRERFPPKLQITVSASAPTGGWTHPRLDPYVFVQPPPNGIYDFDFVADPPAGPAAEVLTPIEVAHVWENFPEEVKGVRVHATQNSKTALLDGSHVPGRQPNRYTLNDCGKTTRILFFPHAFGPLGAPQSRDAQLEYHGPEGELIFRGNDISQEQTALGTVVSVTIKPNADAGGLDFALVLPPVNLGGEAQQDFETIGIRIMSRGRVREPAGAELAYEVLNLKGAAEDIHIL